ncbi:MAG: biopolymer transporter ExbD, partial [Rhodocyclaceae bacterium]
DVMLVLLVIFIVTAPLMTNAVKIDLPKISSQANDLKPEKIEFAINSDGKLFWNGEEVNRAVAQERFMAEGTHQPQPEVHVHADQNVAYKYVAEVMADASKAGLSKIGFVSMPED